MASQTRRPSHQVTFAVLALGIMAYSLLQSLVTPVLATIQVDLHTTQSTVTWVLTAYLLSASIFTPIMGRIGDMIGKERVFVACLVALAVGSVLAAVATNVMVLIIARVIQGVGGGVLPLAFGIVRDEFPKEKVTGAVGMIASLTAVGAGLGIVLAGPIVSVLNYHWLFWIPLIMTIIAAVAAHFFIPESPVTTPGKISWTPAILLSAWLVCLLVALSEAPEWGWGSVRVLGLIAVAIVVAAVWVVTETKVVSPLIDMKMMRLPMVWTSNLVALLIGMGMYSVFAFLPEFVQTSSSSGYGFGSSITQSGLMLLPSSVTMFFAGMYTGGLIQKVGGKLTVVAGNVIGLVAMLMFAFAHGDKWEIYVATGIMGFGFGLVFAALSSLIVMGVPPEQTGVASGMNANIRTIGGSIGSAVMASIVTSSAVHQGGLPKESGYTTGFAVMGGALLLAAVAGLLIPKVVKRERTTLSGDDLDQADLRHGEMAMVAGGTVVGDESE